MAPVPQVDLLMKHWDKLSWTLTLDSLVLVDEQPQFDAFALAQPDPEWNRELSHLHEVTEVPQTAQPHCCSKSQTVSGMESICRPLLLPSPTGCKMDPASSLRRRSYGRTCRRTSDRLDVEWIEGSSEL